MPISHALRKTRGYRLPYLDHPVTCLGWHPRQVYGVCATSKERKQRAKAGLAQPIPLVSGTNVGLPSSVENNRGHIEMGATTRPCHIQWMQNLDADLVKCDEAITLPQEGRVDSAN